MYTPQGLTWVSAGQRDAQGRLRRGTVPWDSVKPIRYKNPIGPHTTAVRHTILIRDHHFGGPTGTPNTLGFGGSLGPVTRKDIGRTLTVDKLPDGRWIDHISTEKAVAQTRVGDASRRGSDWKKRNEAVEENFGAIYHHHFAVPATGISAQRPWSRQDFRDYYQQHPDLPQLVGDELAEQIRKVFE